MHLGLSFGFEVIVLFVIREFVYFNCSFLVFNVAVLWGLSLMK